MGRKKEEKEGGEEGRRKKEEKKEKKRKKGRTVLMPHGCHVCLGSWNSQDTYFLPEPTPDAVWSLGFHFTCNITY
jgi:hypothetical protein